MLVTGCRKASMCLLCVGYLCLHLKFLEGKVKLSTAGISEFRAWEVRLVVFIFSVFCTISIFSFSFFGLCIVFIFKVKNIFYFGAKIEKEMHALEP